LNKKMREIKAKITEKKAAARNLLAENKLEEAKKIKDEILNLQDEFDVESALLDEEKELPEDKSTKNKVEYNGALFCKAVANSILKQRNLPGITLTEDEQAKVTEYVGEDGGYAVPEDISVKINKRLKENVDLQTLVDNEKVYTRKGERTYEKRASQTTLTNLDEYGTITEKDTPQLERLKFNLHDFAGMVTIPNDLLQFASSELETYIIDWLVDKVRFTRNYKILYGNGGADDAPGIMSSDKYKKVPLVATAALKDFKKLKNIELMNVFKATAKWIVNQDGFNYLDTLEDKMGRPYLQPDPKDSTKYVFLGLPVIELPNELLKSTETVVPIVLGDLKEAYKYFYDDNYQLLTTNIGAGAFETNTTKTRVITKLDGTVKDKDAIIIAELAVTV
jgi:HK97 family phage major capsid protein